MDKIELLPCPFCGGEAEIEEMKRGILKPTTGYWITCKLCGCHSRAGFDRRKAVEDWNRRQPNV